MSGQNFSPSQGISIQVDGVVLVSTVTTNNGAFSADVTLPSNLSSVHIPLPSAKMTSGRQVQKPLVIVAPQSRIMQTFHLVGTILPRQGAPLLQINAMLDCQRRTTDRRL